MALFDRFVLSVLQSSRWMIAGAAGALLGNIGLGTGVGSWRIVVVSIAIMVVGTFTEFLIRSVEGMADDEVPK